jgi:hypothetical protein
MLRLVLGSPAGGLDINGSDGRSLLSSRPEVACVPLVTTARAFPLLSLVLWEGQALHAEASEWNEKLASLLIVRHDEVDRSSVHHWSDGALCD